MHTPLHDFASRLFPICRSITGNGVRETLKLIKERLPDLQIYEVDSGTKCFDWNVPDEWNITSAKLIGPDNEVICDFEANNLHVVGYSEPVNIELDLNDLQPHLHSLPELPDAVPYITSYYRRTWGFCLADRVRQNLKSGKYRVVIDSTLEPGSLSYGELLIKGETDEEVLLSTYVCHPSMANNELSGPVVTSALAEFIDSLKGRKLSYRVVFIPETIGSIVYISRNLEVLKDRTIAGFVVSCVGDNREYSYLESRDGDTLADRVAKHVLNDHYPEFKSYPYALRGSDERNYCWPGIDLPVCSIMRTKYGKYPEYHTSLDDLSLISEEGLQGALDVYIKCIEVLEKNTTLRTTVLGEPQMGKRDLYPATSALRVAYSARALIDLLAYCDGKLDLLGVADKLGKSFHDIYESACVLLEHDLLTEI